MPSLSESHSSADQRRELEQQALLAARTLVDQMRTLYRELESRTGAPIAMHRALAAIDAEPGIRASQLASQLGMQRPAVSHLLRALVMRRWIERRRSQEDQRSVRLHVSARGRTALTNTSGRVVGTLQRAVGNLTDVQLSQLAASLAALLKGLPSPAPTVVGSRKSPLPRRTAS